LFVVFIIVIVVKLIYYQTTEQTLNSLTVVLFIALYLSA